MLPKLIKCHAFVIPSLGIIWLKLYRFIEQRKHVFKLFLHSSANEIETNGLKRLIIEPLGKFVGFSIGFPGFGEGIRVEALISVGNKGEDAKSQLFVFRQSFDLWSLHKPLCIFSLPYLLAPYEWVFQFLRSSLVKHF